MIVFVAPVGEHDPRLEQRVEELTVQELVAQARVERLDPGVLPGRARIDEDRRRCVEATPVGNRIGGELGPVVTAQETGDAALGHEAIEQTRHVLSGDRALDLNGQALARELIDHFEKFERLAITRLVELKVERPHDVGRDGDHGPHVGAHAAKGLLALAVGDFQAL